MAIDPSIPLSVRPAQIQSPLEVIQPILQIQAAREQTEARRFAAEETRQKKNREAQEAQGLANLFATTPKPTLQDFTQIIGPERAVKLAEGIQALTRVEGQQVTDARSEAGHLVNGLLALPPAMQTAVWPRVRQAAIRGGLGDEATIPETPSAEYLQAVQAWAGGEKPKLERVTTVNAAGEPVEQFVVPTEGATYKQPPKVLAPAAAPTIGSFEDYLARDAAQRGKALESYTTADIDAAREKYRLDPRITVNAGGGGQRPITQTAEAGLISRLNTQWTAATKGPRELSQQVATMRLGLAAAERGDMAQGTEAVLQPFLKILDPTSVVREGEFFRLREGQSYLARAQGIVQRLTKGGFVPLPELQKYAALAEEIAKRQNSYVADVRGRIGKVADRYSIPQELVFESEAPPTDVRPPPATTPGAGPKIGERRTIKGQLAEWDGKGWKAVR